MSSSSQHAVHTAGHTTMRVIISLMRQMLASSDCKKVNKHSRLLLSRKNYTYTAVRAISNTVNTTAELMPCDYEVIWKVRHEACNVIKHSNNIEDTQKVKTSAKAQCSKRTLVVGVNGHPWKSSCIRVGICTKITPKSAVPWTNVYPPHNFTKIHQQLLA